MRKVLVTLKSEEKSIEYFMDLDTSTFESALTDAAGNKTVVQTGTIGQSDAERQDLALRMYHILLAALRAPTHEGS
jgi:hypothetical protein